MSLEQSLLRCWYARWGWCLFLIPFSWLFALVSGLRRTFYGLIRPKRLPVPVIVVGNLTVGGTGKTPLVLWLVACLRAAGYRPGVISRGYGVPERAASEVSTTSDAVDAGDEPVLIARRGLCPVWVGRRRTEAALGLLKSHPEVDVIVSDDGLQHYALARDLEIAVVDGRRGFGNGWRLPAGPMREGRSRLRDVDAVVVNGDLSLDAFGAPTYAMRLSGSLMHGLGDPSRQAALESFRGRTVNAVAGIGNPARFFDVLIRAGMTVVPHAYPDHHRFRPADLPPGTVIMTEKDAVKCAGFRHPDAWVFVVDAEVSGGLEKQVLNKLETHHG